MAISYNALTAPLSQKVQEFLSTGSFTVPSNCTTVDVVLVGGGGGGGAAYSSAGGTNRYAGGGGGAGAQVVKKTLSVTAGSTYTVTVGAGGAASTTAANAAKGGDSSFGSLATALGGSSAVTLDDNSATWYVTNINTGWGVGSMASSVVNANLYVGVGTSSGGSPILIGNISTFPANTYSLNNYGYSNFWSGAGIVMSGPTIDNFGGGGATANITTYNAYGTGTYVLPSMPGPYAGAGGSNSTLAASPYQYTGGAGTANYGGGGGGGLSRNNVAASLAASGGNGGSGYCRVTYWS
jgi:hypothetical protein